MSAHKTLSATLFAVLLVFAGVCEGPPEALADPAAPAEAEAAVATSPVKNIVFIGKEKACDCTKERVDASRAILTRVLEAAPIPVKTLHVDKEDERAEANCRRAPQTCDDRARTHGGAEVEFGGWAACD